MSNKISSSEVQVKWYRDGKFWAGFVGWLVINFMVFQTLPGVLYQFNNRWGQYFSAILLLTNIAALVGFAMSKKNKRVASGILAAFAILFLFTLLAGILLFVYCYFNPYTP